MSRGALRAALALGLLVLAAPAAHGQEPGTAPQATWHAASARVPEARAAGRDGEGVLVAVLDTWVDGSHRDFEGRVLAGADCTSGTCREGAPAPDPCTHGTHVAGTVASSSYGVAPRARVLPVKVLAHRSDDGECTGSDRAVAAGIRYAVARGARVLNLSLGTLVPGLSSSSAITAAVGDASRAGAVVVFAAGNSGVPVTDTYGGSALVVAATGPEGRLAGYSQRGAGVGLAAPGGDPPTLSSCTRERCVTSLFPGGRYAVAAGTSMAAPHVAGTAALLLAQDPSRSRQAVLDRLQSTARPVPGGGAGAGLLDAAAALGVAARETASPPAPPPSTAPPQEPAPQSEVAPVPVPLPAEATSPPAPPPPATPPPPAPAATGVPAAPEPLPTPPDDVAVVAEPVPPPPAAAPPVLTEEGLPPGPPVVAGALVAAGLLATAVTGLRR